MKLVWTALERLKRARRQVEQNFTVGQALSKRGEELIADAISEESAALERLAEQQKAANDKEVQPAASTEGEE